MNQRTLRVKHGGSVQNVLAGCPQMDEPSGVLGDEATELSYQGLDRIPHPAGLQCNRLAIELAGPAVRCYLLSGRYGNQPRPRLCSRQRRLRVEHRLHEGFISNGGSRL